MGELLVTFGEDGKTHIYDSDFDVTIHCENEQQMNEAVELLHLANRMHWRKTAETPPTKEDAEKADSFVLSVYYSEFYKKWRICQQTWELVVALQDEYPFWMPLPELPEALR